MTCLAELSDIYLHRDAVDFRKSINGLMIIVENVMKLSPFNGAIFVFCNKARDKLKVLYWDNTGFCLWYKRLEKDKFKWPKKSTSSIMNLSEQQWRWLLAGLDLTKMKGHQAISYEAIQ